MTFGSASEQALHESCRFARESRFSLRAEDLLPSTEPLYFEPSQIEQVLLNLLDNVCNSLAARAPLK